MIVFLSLSSSVPFHSKLVSLLDDCNSFCVLFLFQSVYHKATWVVFCKCKSGQLILLIKTPQFPPLFLHCSQNKIQILYYDFQGSVWPCFCQICLLQLSFFSAGFNLFNPFDFWTFCFLCLEYFLSTSLCSRLTLSLETST